MYTNLHLLFVFVWITTGAQIFSGIICISVNRKVIWCHKVPFTTKIKSLSVEHKIRWLYPLQKSKTLTPKKECPKYDAKLHLVARLEFCSYWECSVSLHCHYFQLHSDPVRVQSMDQIDLLKNHSYFMELCAKNHKTLRAGSLIMIGRLILTACKFV